MKSEEGFPQGEKRRKLIKDDAGKILGVQRKTREKRFAYPVYDSLLEPGPFIPNDPINDIQNLGAFQHTFQDVLPKGEVSLRRYIESSLAHRRGKAILVECGGPARILSADFSPGFLRKSVGITLAHVPDNNSLVESERRKHYEERGHEILEGDILSPETYIELDKRLGGEKVDIIFERMLNGLELVPNEPYTLAKVLQIWYGLLREGGMLFAQVMEAGRAHKLVHMHNNASRMHNLVVAWAAMIQKDYGSVIDIQCSPIDSPNNVVRLRKLTGAPEKLPMLKHRTVRNIGIERQ